jgi:hypothetical protein
VTPKHIRASARRNSARTRRSLEIALLAFALVLAGLVFVTEIHGGSEDPGASAGGSGTATNPPTDPATNPATDSGGATATPMAPATTTAMLRPPPGERLADPGFERGLGAWRALSGELLPDSFAHGGAVGAALTGPDGATVSSGPIGMVKVNENYVGTVWIRAERPGTEVELRLLERVNGRAFATDLVGDVAGPTWQQLEVIHTGHRKGAVLELQVAAPRLGGGALFIDDASLRAKGGSPMSGMSP